jgi:hypothetical protein
VEQHADAVGQREHGVHVVLDQQDAVLPLQALQQGHDLRRFDRPHAGHRLVQQQHLGCMASAIAISSWRCCP